MKDAFLMCYLYTPLIDTICQDKIVIVSQGGNILIHTLFIIIIIMYQMNKISCIKFCNFIKHTRTYIHTYFKVDQQQLCDWLKHLLNQSLGFMTAVKVGLKMKNDPSDSWL